MIICDDLHLIRQTLSDQIESDDRFTLHSGRWDGRVLRGR